MTTQVDVKDAIDAIRDKAKQAEKSEDAVRFSQAALNLAHVASTFANMSK